MLLKGLKAVSKRILGKYDLRVYSIPKTNLTGFEFWNDLKLIVRKDDPVCLDVGANTGQTIRELRRWFSSPKIFAFEPATDTFASLSKNFLASEVQLYPYALGEGLGREEFINYENSTLSSFLELSANQSNRFRNSKIGSREIVEVRTVDWFVTQEDLAVIDLLKIDTQGCDLEVLRGAENSLARGIIGTIMLELNFIEMYHGQGAVHEIEGFLARFGYHLVDYYGKARIGHTISWCNGVYCKRPQSLVSDGE